jgi:oxygen-independent coproporphyrinogen-3 oxidase
MAQQAGYIPYYMYRQKNTVGNYENVGFSKPGHEGLYNVYMMEELHTIFASGAGGVTKLVDFAANEGLEKKY